MERRKRSYGSSEHRPDKKLRRRIIYSSSEDEDEIKSFQEPRVDSSSRVATTRDISSPRVRQKTPPANTRGNGASRERLNSTNNVASPPSRSSRPRRRVLSPIVIVRQEPSPTSSIASSPERPAPAQAALAETELKDSEELDEETLQLLGNAPKVDTPLGPAIHKDIASRWQDILSKGLPKDQKDKLLEEYLVPSNCDLLQAPALNPEAKVPLNEVMIRRDVSLMHKQRQIGLALSALATTMEMVVLNETSKTKLLKPLSDACRILCDSHYMETKTRRSLILSSINTDLKETLTEVPRDSNFLFGENVSEKVKTAKNIQRSGEVLKQPRKFSKNNFLAKQNKNRPNFKPVHRKTDNKWNSADGVDSRPARAPPAPRQTYSASRNRSYREYRERDQRDRSPPPRRPYYRR
ncbi:uncharacterized protein LOC125229407 [Leguminivora glycinivorella]|uniref:uncharacterized protein LOC125229407 n=1 Tax=Leguminivora glycinivorella TaxID=1035111 RepID=UPI00200C347B|nr:uncharacterized protein LOC125229407 [Leguminivora glycinivorella]